MCTAIFRSPQRHSVEFKSGLWLGYSKTFTEWSRSHCFLVLDFCLSFFGLLEDEPLLQSEDHSALEQVNINDDFVHCCIYLSLDLDKSHSSLNIMLPPPCFIVGIVLLSCAWFPPDITLSIQAKEFNPCFIRLENFVSQVMGVLQVSVGRLSCAFS